jgi:uncharacterized protein
MKFVVIFEDNPEAGSDLRRRYMAQHLAFLEHNSARVRAAGPLQTDDGQGVGGLWLVEATDAAEVDRLVKEDPFWPTGLRKSLRILVWRQVYAEGQRLIAP